MSSELSKTISTCTIWLAVACILTFGIFKMSVNGDLAVLLLFFCMPVSFVAAAVVATTVIWGSRRDDKMRRDSAVAPVPAQPIPPTIKS